MYKIFSSKIKGYLTGIKYFFCLFFVVYRTDLEEQQVFNNTANIFQLSSNTF